MKIENILNTAGMFFPKYKDKIQNAYQQANNLLNKNNGDINAAIKEAGISKDFIQGIKPYTSNPMFSSLFKQAGLEVNQVNNILDEVSSNMNNNSNRVDIPNQNLSSGENMKNPLDISKLARGLEKVKKNY